MTAQTDSDSNSSAEATAEPPDRVAALLAVGSFAFVMGLAVIAYLLHFRFSPALKHGVTYGVILLGAVALRYSVPTSRLPPAAKRRREHRRLSALTGTLVAILILVSATAAFSLNSWSEWVVLGMLLLIAIGIGIMLNTRFTMGPGR